MIVVLASRYDELARELVSQWEAQGAALLTCGDLSTAGWCHYVGSPGLATAVIAGRRVAAGEITGVLTRMAFLAEQELVDIVPSDRAYAASEMTAFLLSWLSNLTCPVLNPPTPTSLCGPYWRSEQWNSIAKTAGMRVQQHNGAPARLEESCLGIAHLAKAPGRLNIGHHKRKRLGLAVLLLA